MVIIEFSGLSCVGKSTLIRRLEHGLKREGILPCVIQGDKTPSRLDVLRGLSNLRLAAWLLLNPNLAAKRKVLSVVRILAGGIGLINRIRSDGGLVLLDEGPVKTHQRDRLHHTRFKTLLIRSLPVPDVLVIVTCDPKVRLKRLRETGRTYARELSDEKLLSDADPTERAARSFALARNVPVIEVDTTSGDDQSATLLQRLRPFYDSGSVAPSC